MFYKFWKKWRDQQLGAISINKPNRATCKLHAPWYLQINDNIIPYQHNSMIKYWINACWAVRPGEVFFPLLWLLFISCQNDGQYSISIHYQVRFFKKICVDMSNSDTTMWQGSSFLSSNLLWKKMSRLNGAPQKLKRGSTD